MREANTAEAHAGCCRREDAEVARRPETPAERRRRDIRTCDGSSGPGTTPRSGSDADGPDDGVDLAYRSYVQDGVWFDIEHKPYRGQQRATDPAVRTFVDDLIRGRDHEREPADPTHSGRLGEVVIIRSRSNDTGVVSDR